MVSFERPKITQLTSQYKVHWAAEIVSAAQEIFCFYRIRLFVACCQQIVPVPFKLSYFTFSESVSVRHVVLCYFIYIIIYHHYPAVAQWLRCCATNRKVAGSIPSGVSGFFIDIKSFRSHCGPGVDSSSNRNEYQDYFLGVKAAGT